MPPFEFPKIHDFPPFYTKQPVRKTWEVQRRNWADLILSYCKASKKFLLNVSQDLQSDLFNNKNINRSLSRDVLVEILEYMNGEGEIEWDTSVGKQTQCFVYWRKPAEWASLIHTWITSQGLENNVITFFELTNPDPDTNELILDPNEEVFAIHSHVMNRALKILKTQGKVTLFTGSDADSLGIKFHS
ncbi:hypothetical protein BB560_001633 [Smittium megazygosporum]|uniref:Vacuolar protein-sorting-associated protein 25 n=1 Tax=Smittium megazygosporum TaxID=133381 RepID=A0A2T9ZH03_9FUNG|nr:hypothetical protein BB560_001633 [Smittium megazygosporum]